MCIRAVTAVATGVAGGTGVVVCVAGVSSGAHPASLLKQSEIESGVDVGAWIKAVCGETFYKLNDCGALNGRGQPKGSVR